MVRSAARPRRQAHEFGAGGPAREGASLELTKAKGRVEASRLLYVADIGHSRAAMPAEYHGGAIARPAHTPVNASHLVT
jgi:hypothetical protein